MAEQSSNPIQPPTVQHWTAQGANDEFEDGDSALGPDSESSTASISASILEYRTIHGRTYHAQKGDAEYWGPNDSRQTESMDILHAALTMALEDKLFVAPLPDKIDKVLDIGTGSGVWAIDFADERPETEVIGTDLSPTQPSWVPPNLKFEIDDATQPWTFAPNSFDYIHIRNLFGSISDWTALFKEAYKATQPGGWVESVEMSIVVQSDDSTVAPGMALYDWGRTFHEAGKKIGRSLAVVEEGLVEEGMKAAGFTDIVVKKIKLPNNGYPADEKQRKIGIYTHYATDQALEGYAMYLLTQVMKWEPEQVQLYVARTRKELRLKRVHPWSWLQVAYGRKPESA